MALLRPPRRCSICRQPGHTKRTCLSRQQFEPTKEKAPKSTVFVCDVTEHEPSKHTVDLRTTQKDTTIEVPVYTAPTSATPQRQTVSFGPMIEAHKLAKIKEAMRHQQVVAYNPEPVEPVAPVEETPAPHVVEPPKEALPAPAIVNEPQPRARFTINWSWSAFGQLAPRFAAIMIAVMLPVFGLFYTRSVQAFGSHTATKATSGFSHLQESTLAALDADIGGAEYHLQRALAAFAEANTMLEDNHKVAQSVAGILPVIGDEMHSRRAILEAGHKMSMGNAYLLKGVGALTDDELPLTDKLDRLHHHVKAATPQFVAANDLLQSVNPSAVPVEYQALFDDVQVLFTAFVNDLDDMSELLVAIEDAFGSDEFKRYIVVFQNNHELRATGGFMGSFAVVDIQKGKIQRIDVPGGGLYDLQGQLAAYVAPPQPLQLVNKRWETQDANWWPDFAASSQKLQWFYERSRGTTVDGVIAVNGSMLESILPILGPIAIESASTTFTSDNVLTQMHSIIREEADTGNTAPKAIVGDMLTQVLDVFNTADARQKVQVLSAVHKGMASKDIQVYTQDPSVQDTLRSFGWTGEIRPSADDQDYLFVTQTNIGGSKTDANINQSITHQAHIQPNGDIINTVVIKRENKGSVYIDNHFNSHNVSYSRVYVPQGAVLLDAAGFDFPKEEWFQAPEPWYEEDPHVDQLEILDSVDQESGTHIYESFGKTVFANWMQVAPGEVSEAYIVYKLPFSLMVEERQTETGFASAMLSPMKQTPSLGYSLLVQKQSGILNNFSSQIIFPTGYEPLWTSTDDMRRAKNGVTYETGLEHDMIIATVAKEVIE